MTISSDIASASYTGNGVTQIFPVPFYFLVNTDLKVSQKSAATGLVSVLTLNSAYTVSGAGNEAGGSITILTAPASGDQIFVERDVDAVQETAYPENGIFPAASHEQALDRLTMLVQQLETADDYTLMRNPLLGYYDVGGNRLSNIADGTGPNDAVSLQQQTQAIAAAQITPATPPADIALYSVLAGDSGATKLQFKSTLTGAVRTTLQKILDGSEVHSSWFGADATGATDSSAALQLALNAAAGRVLVIDAGTYKLGTALKVKSGTTVRAYGAIFTRGTSSLNNFIRNDSDGVTGGFGANVDINILGGKWDSTGGTGNCTVIAFTHASRCQVRDATIYNENQWHHVECNACDDVVIEHCYFNGGYTTASEAAEAIQIDCASDTTWPGPYDNTPCNNIVVRNCHFESVSNCVGSHTEPATINHSRILVADCFANFVMEAFVKPLAWSDVKVINNKVQNCGYGYLQLECTVTLRAQNDIEIIGNTFYNVGNTTFTRINSHGIQINGNATNTISRPINVRIANNFIFNVATTGLHGMSLQFIQRGTITANVINTTQGCGIYVYGGEHVTVSGNSVMGNNSIANAGYASIKVGGTGLGTDTIRVTVTGNTCDTIIADFVNRTIVTTNVVNTSAALTNGSGGSTLVYNLINATWA